jgi:hypothetical protein
MPDYNFLPTGRAGAPIRRRRPSPALIAALPQLPPRGVFPGAPMLPAVPRAVPPILGPGGIPPRLPPRSVFPGPLARPAPRAAAPLTAAALAAILAQVGRSRPRVPLIRRPPRLPAPTGRFVF